MIKLRVDGFPRTGNTFLDQAVRLAYPTADIGQGISHSTSSMLRDIKLHYDVRYILPIRKPMPTLESGILMAMSQDRTTPVDVLASRAISGYCSYHWTLLDKYRIFIAPFEVFTVNLPEILDKLDSAIPELAQHRVHVTNDDAMTHTKEALGYKDGKSPDVMEISANIPRDRHPIRDVILESLKSSEAKEQLILAEKYYEILSNRYYEDRQLV